HLATDNTRALRHVSRTLRLFRFLLQLLRFRHIILPRRALMPRKLPGPLSLRLALDVPLAARCRYAIQSAAPPDAHFGHGCQLPARVVALAPSPALYDPTRAAPRRS